MQNFSPHAYTPAREADPWQWAPCRFCKHGPGHSIHLLELPGIVPPRVSAPLFEPQDEPEEVQPDRTDQLTMF